MIRWVLLLMVGIYLALQVAGADHGQRRQGLLAADTNDPQDVLASAGAAVVETAAAKAAPQEFLPAQPVVQPTQPVIQPVARTVAVTEPAPVAEAAPVAEPAPETTLLRYVGANSVNVREGPGKSFAVLDTLKPGEAVTVVSAEGGEAGWSLIRIEGDGIEGYVATRLLKD